MRLIVGLGNPGSQYQNTRHNVGFMAVDEISRRYGFVAMKVKAGAKALVLDGTIPGLGRVLMVKPQTFMNLSGEAVAPLLRFYKIDPDSMIVLQDEVDLPFARVRLKDGGGLAGHNGLKSLAKLLGTRDFKRIRMGVGRPEGRKPMAAHVLSDFTKKESIELAIMIDRGADATLAILGDGMAAAMNHFNTLD